MHDLGIKYEGTIMATIIICIMVGVTLPIFFPIIRLLTELDCDMTSLRDRRVVVLFIIDQPS